jgi:hypothetical protein
VKVLLVDLDDTLLDYTGGVEESWAEVGQAVAGPAGVDARALTNAIADSRRWFWGDPDRHRRERTDMLGAWRKIAAGGLERLGGGCRRAAGTMAEDFAACRRAAMRLFPEWCRASRRSGTEGSAWDSSPTGTAGSSGQDRALRPRALLRRDRHRGRVRGGKPRRVGVSACPGRAQGHAARGAMVGDNLEWDVAPQRLGLRGGLGGRVRRGPSAGQRRAAGSDHRAFPALVEAGE